jgi:hypothetical protein
VADNTTTQPQQWIERLNAGELGAAKRRLGFLRSIAMVGFARPCLRESQRRRAV